MEKQHEREYLREEINTNKKLVFERGIAIVAIGLGASLISENNLLAYLLGLPTLAALAFNLWLTTNRLESNARIIAYFQMFHEPNSEIQWIGWENSLRLYRIWSNSKDREAQAIMDSDEHIQQYDNLSFYTPILHLHRIMAALLCIIISLAAWSAEGIDFQGLELPPIAISIVYLVAFAVFIIWSLRFDPNKLQQEIEKSLFHWKAIFRAYKTSNIDLPNYDRILSKIIQKYENS